MFGLRCPVSGVSIQKTDDRIGMVTVHACSIHHALFGAVGAEADPNFYAD
jgi:hypothetical protein